MASPDVQDVAQARQPSGDSSSFLRWILIAGLIVILGGAAVFGVRMLPAENPRDRGSLAFPVRTTPTGPPGKIFLDESTTHTFGVMTPLSKGSHTWKFKNTGEGPLELSKGTATCSCTIANFKDDKQVLVLKPGETTEINLTWSPKAEADGKFEHNAAVNVVGDPVRSTVVFVVEGTVRPAVAIMPKERILSFGDVPNDATDKVNFAMISADRPDLKILSITSSHPDLLAFNTKPLPDADRKALEWTTMPGGHLVEVELKPSKDVGVFSEDITVTTDHPKLKEIRLTVSGRRSGPISVIPQSAQMHNVNGEEGRSTTVMLIVRNAPETKFEVVQAPENLKVEIVGADVKSGSAAKVRQYRMTVTVPPGSPPGVIEGMISLKSDHPNAGRLSVPVDVTVIGGDN